MGNGIGCSSVLDFWNYRFSSSSIVRILANETSFLNPQVDADGEKDKQAAQELERPGLAKRIFTTTPFPKQLDCLPSFT
jgi:hypothetical protein